MRADRSLSLIVPLLKKKRIDTVGLLGPLSLVDHLPSHSIKATMTSAA